VKNPVILGCDAVDAGPDWVRLREPGGHLRTIPWSSIRMAGVPNDGAHVTFEGDLGQISALHATHDALWIESGEGMVIALLEKEHPKREAILAAFKERLGSRWLGDRLTSRDAAMRLFKAPELLRGGARSGGLRKLVIVMMIAIFVMFLLAFVGSRFAR
jgi:hypothetical protein